MSDSELLKAEFAGRGKQIRMLRSDDPEFDEICSDYLLLFRELADHQRSSGRVDQKYLTSIRESLSDLHEEIERALSGAFDKQNRLENKQR